MSQKVTLLPAPENLPRWTSWWEHAKTGHIVRVIICSRDETSPNAWLVCYQEQATLEYWTRNLPVFLERFARLAPERVPS